MRSAVLALATVALLATGAAVKERPALETSEAKLSYALGMDLGKQLRKKKVEIDAAVFARGLTDALAGEALLLTEAESRALVSALQEEMQRREFASVVETAEKNKRDADAFLAANRQKEGIVVLDSGLQYRVLVAGAGRKPTIDDTVLCHYRGTFIDGTEFDSSNARGEAATLPVKSVMKGWSEALQRMPVGSKWQLFIPPDLAYGSRGAGGGRIAPNTTLVFDVELMGIK